PWSADRGGCLLRIFFCVLLHKSHCALAEWTSRQSGVRLLRSACSAGFYRRSGVPIALVTASAMVPARLWHRCAASRGVGWRLKIAHCRAQRWLLFAVTFAHSLSEPMQQWL